jgi:hypothetical protein
MILVTMKVIVISGYAKYRATMLEINIMFVIQIVYVQYNPLHLELNTHVCIPSQTLGVLILNVQCWIWW